MALNGKKKKVVNAGLPTRFVALARQAATFKVAADHYEAAFKETKRDIKDYVASDDCTLTIDIGDKNPKIEGVGTVIFSEPERLDNKAAAFLIAQKVAAGEIQAADLAELISMVNKSALSKLVDAKTLETVKAQPGEEEDGIQISVRVAGEFRALVAELLPNLKVGE